MRSHPIRIQRSLYALVVGTTTLRGAGSFVGGGLGCQAGGDISDPKGGNSGGGSGGGGGTTKGRHFAAAARIPA